MKKEYTSPELEMIVFDSEDVITASTDSTDTGNQGTEIVPVEQYTN